MQDADAPFDRPLKSSKISIAAARKMLGMVGRNYSDSDILEVINALYGIAEEGYELYQDVGNPSGRRE